ncbi:MAG: VOC family protein [Acidobacteriota bacterium]|nr:VOC family protein [Acidobacteriota bacterium]
MELTPYLFFNGNCAEAFRFYEQTLGGKIEALMKASDAPPSGGAGPQMAGDSVMHACLTVGKAVLMGSDDPTSYSKPQGNWVSVSVESADEARRIFDIFAEGGKVNVPFEPTFWSPGFAMVIDRFGTPWMINTKPAE